jgi:hypothetical protein
MGNLLSIFSGSGKPPSLPTHYPYSSQEELDARPQRVVLIGAEEQDYTFCDNSIRTSKVCI